MPDASQELRIRLNAETGRIAWPELAPHFARGVVVRVDDSLDLVEVAAGFAENRSTAVEQWMSEGKVARADDADAKRWTQAGTEFWAVVVAPWVLVQENVRGET
jgi:hypothetical protein